MLGGPRRPMRKRTLPTISVWCGPRTTR